MTLLIPWLNQEDQALVFHGKHSFEQPEEQTECIKDWVRKRTGFEAQFKIQYYPGRYDTSLLGIFPIGDLTVYIPVEEVSLRMLGQTHSSTHAQIQLFALGTHRRPDAGSLQCMLCQHCSPSHCDLRLLEATGVTCGFDVQTAESAN